MTTGRHHLLVVAWIGIVLSAAGCNVQVGESGGLSVGLSQGRASDEWTRTYEIEAGGQLEIVNVTGRIAVAPAEGAEVVILAQRQVSASTDEGASAALESLDMAEAVAPDRVRVEALQIEGGPSSSFGRVPRVEIHYDVRVPDGLRLSLRTGNGGITLEQVAGHIAVSATNGGVRGERLAGSFEVTTVNGGIRMHVASLSGDVNMVTVNGGVQLDLPLDTDAQIDASSVNGGIVVDERFAFRETERDRRRLIGTLNDGGPTISLRTTNGPIRIGAQ